jgi:hypothetical protein
VKGKSAKLLFVKNSLLEIAIKDSGLDEFAKFIKEPLLLLCCNEPLFFFEISSDLCSNYSEDVVSMFVRENKLNEENILILSNSRSCKNVAIKLIALLRYIVAMFSLNIDIVLTNLLRSIQLFKKNNNI